MRDEYEDCGTELYRTFWRTGQGVYRSGEANPSKGKPKGDQQVRIRKKMNDV